MITSLTVRSSSGIDPALRGIDRSSRVPFYYQLQEILKEEIENGRWRPGELVPSEAALENTFGVSRTVIRKALDILEDDGQVHRVKGKGTFVSEPKFRYEAVAAAAGWQQRTEATAELSRLISSARVQVGGHIGRLLGLSPSDEVFELTMVHSVKGTPASLTHMFLTPDATPGLDGGLPLLEEGGADVRTQLRTRYGLEIAESHWSIEAAKANHFEAELLEIAEGEPTFLLASLELQSGKIPAAFFRGVVRSDHFHFSVAIRHNRGETAAPFGISVPSSHPWSSIDWP